MQTALTQEQLARWNRIRAEAGEDPIDRAMAEWTLSLLDEEEARKLLEKLNS